MLWKLLTILCLIPTMISCLRISDVMEPNLHEVITNLDNKPPKIDFQWMRKVKQWHVPMWSKLYAFLVASEILQKDDICEKELESSCLQFNQDLTIDGYGKPVDFKVHTSDNHIGFTGPWSGSKAKFAYKLTDNESFIMGITSWDDGKVGWAVISTKDKLDDETENTIKEYITTVGFDPDLTVKNKYRNCPNHNSRESSDEL